jgi:hypothetical protein
MSTIENIQIGAAAFRRPLRPTDVVRVQLASPSGARWSAIGGGETVGEAVAFAIASAPADTTWHVVGWSDVFGD